MRKRLLLMMGIILTIILFISTALFIGGRKTRNPNPSAASQKIKVIRPVTFAPQPTGQIINSVFSTPKTSPESTITPLKTKSPDSKKTLRPRPLPQPSIKPKEIEETFLNARAVITPEPSATPETDPANLTVKTTPFPVAVRPASTPPPAVETASPSPVPESRLKIACDFESLGLGYEMIRKKKTSLDLMIYTDKAGLGVSYRFAGGIHLGVDNTYKYQNGERQLRLYLSMSIQPGE